MTMQFGEWFCFMMQRPHKIEFSKINPLGGKMG